MNTARLSQYVSPVNRSYFQPRSLLLALSVMATPALAQSDSAVKPATRTVAADSLQPPITPGRAFFRSLLLPGSAQNKLGRNKVGAGIIAVEVISIGMIR